MTTKRLRLLVALAFAVMTGSASAALLFDNSGRQHIFVEGAGSEFSPLAAITVAQDTTINQIGALVDLKDPGSLNFLIFEFTALDFTAGNLLFSTGAESFAAGGQTYKVSGIFDFVLHAGTTYAIGAIANVDASWGVNSTSSGNPLTQNGVTASDDVNGNAFGFTSPHLIGPGSAMVMLQLYGVLPTEGGGTGGTGGAGGSGGGGTVPEPGTLALLGLALSGLGVTRRRRQ